MELLIQKHASLSYWRNYFWDASCCSIFVYECIDCVSSSFLQTTPIFSAKEKSVLFICGYVCLGFLLKYFIFSLSSVTLSSGRDFFSHSPLSLHSLVWTCFELSFSEQVQTTSFSQKALNELSFFPPSSFPPKTLAYLCCLKNSLAVKFCRSSLYKPQAWVAVSVLQWIKHHWLLYCSSVSCDNGFWYLLWYHLHLPGTTKGAITDEDVVGISTV